MDRGIRHRNCFHIVLMARGTVVLVGSLPVEHLALDFLVAEFGWSFKKADSLSRLAELNVDHNLVTVLFSPKNLALPWEQALRAILDAAPKALPIVCHGFAETIDWPQVADAGAFHSLRLPFDVREVRQSLGFVWGARPSPATMPIRRRPHPRRAISEHTSQARAYLAGIVA